MKPAVFIAVMVSISTLVSCSSNHEKVKSEIFRAEKEFERLAAEKGLAYAFSYFAADSGVINVRDRLVKGKEEIRKHYLKWETQDVSLQWTADFIDVAASGDLGYTYGRYVFTLTDSTGKVTRNEGIFHTVWKKQKDGNWRFVWD
ncbi:MAG: DUF4440 domain-containing protein [Bacteroidales bacterium]|jgi:ketosteroid isomerase-like protein|nr:DUF4440 domain-containing protein [Bacteroidales bacterium]